MSTPAMTALTDQFTAAAREAGDLLARAGTATGAPVTLINGPGWVRTQIEALVLSLVDGTATFCAHLTGSPSVMLATAWRPGHLTCPTCANTDHAADPTEEGTCDRCRRHVGTTRTAMLALGPLLYAYGLCLDCYPHVHPDTPRSTTTTSTATGATTGTTTGVRAGRRSTRRAQRQARRATRRHR